MKFSAIISFVAAVEVANGLSIISIDDCSSSCELGMFCTYSVPECHGPPESGYCFNGTTSEYQWGCNDGYECADNMCECFIDDMPYATTPPPTATLPPYVTSTPTVTPAPTPTRTPMATPAPTPTRTPMATPAPTPTPTTAPSTPSSNEDGIFTQCPTGTWWEIGATACRGPSYEGECYNPSTAMYQNGCAVGFSCINNKCHTTPPATFSPNVCYVKCQQSDEYCENGATTCRGPNYAGECFNVATGHFQNGCGAGYECANNLCVMS